jgi:lysozyme
MREKRGGRGPILGSPRSLAALAAVLALLLALIAAAAPADAAPRVTAACPTLLHLNGFDVSSFSGTINWSDVTCEHFVYARATDGTFTTDSDFAVNRSGALGAHIPFGAYDYFEPNESGVDQANYFLSVYQPRPGDLPPVLDVEVTDDQTASTIITGISDWVSTIVSATGLVPMIYTYPAFWPADVDNTSLFTADPLWDTDVTATTAPTVPSPWVSSGWTLWQYSFDGTVTGVDGNEAATDLDYFSGASIKSLESSAATTVTIPSVTSGAVVGQPITIHVQVSGAFTGTEVPAPSGTVTVSDGTRTCPAVLSGSGGVATGSCNITEETAGPHSLTAHYPGDSNWHSSSTASATSVTVGKATTKTVLKLSKSSVAYGDEQAEKLSVTVSPQFAGSIPTGSVTIKESSTRVCKIKLSSGKGSCSLSSKELKAARYSLTATYIANRDFDGSVSAKKTLAVVKA